MSRAFAASSSSAVAPPIAVVGAVAAPEALVSTSPRRIGAAEPSVEVWAPATTLKVNENLPVRTLKRLTERDAPGWLLASSYLPFFAVQRPTIHAAMRCASHFPREQYAPRHTMPQ